MNSTISFRGTFKNVDLSSIKNDGIICTLFTVTDKSTQPLDYVCNDQILLYMLFYDTQELIGLKDITVYMHVEERNKRKVYIYDGYEKPKQEKTPSYATHWFFKLMKW